MTTRAIDWFRAVLVAMYALLALALFSGGMSEADLVTMTVMGALAFVAIVAADWINDAPRREDDDRDLR